MNAYKGFTEAQAKAHRKYMEGVATVQIRMTAEKREEVKQHAASMGESVNVFVNRAIDSAMAADVAGTDPAQVAAGVPQGE